MTNYLKPLLRTSLTLLIVVVAIFLSHKLWVRYMDAPWTRDGRVRADVVNIAPDVAGLVVDVAVKDNQFVHRGEVLFRIDTEHYRHAVAEAKAIADQRRAELALKQSQAARRAQLDDEVISAENREDSSLAAASAKADYEAALAKYEKSRLDLSRTVIRSPVDGWVSNLLVRPGDFAQTGTPKLAIIDQHSFWIYGYFEEHKIPLIHPGDPADVELLGSKEKLHGHVESIARGIADRDNPTDVRLLANVNPSFNWVRLAQRVPVRIQIDTVPRDMTLVAGMTCSVIVHPANGAGEKS